MAYKSTCLDKVALDEPIFVLRAQDKIAPIVIRTWITLARWFGVPETKRDEAERCAEAMEKWHTRKIPD